MDINEVFEELGVLLEQGAFNKVIKICDSLLEKGLEHQEIYIVRLMAEAKAKSIRDLRYSEIPLDELESYSAVVEVCDDDFFDYLMECNSISHSQSTLNTLNKEDRQKDFEKEFVDDYYDDEDDNDNDYRRRKKPKRDTNSDIGPNRSSGERKNSKIIGIILLVCLIIGTIGVVGYVLVKNNVFHSHEWVEANCTTPKTCSICGKTEGNPTEHIYVEATCTEARKCSACGETFGEPLGHDVEIGPCGRCGKFANFAMLKQIIDDVDTATRIVPNDLNNAIERDLPTQDLYLAALRDAEEFKTAKKAYQKVIDDCGDYEYFSKIKVAAQKTLNSIPNGVASSDVQSLIDFLSKHKEYLQAVKDTISVMIPYADDIQKAEGN